MSKSVKELIQAELTSRLGGTNNLAVVSFVGIDAQTTREIRGKLRSKSIRVTVVKNAIARQVFKGLGLESAGEAMQGPCALAYGPDGAVEIVRELLAITKDTPKLTVKAALLDGELFGIDRVEELSKYPTREEAIGRLVGAMLGAGGKLVACVVGPGATLAGVLKTIEEKAEKAEPAADASAAVEAAPAEAAPSAPSA